MQYDLVVTTPFGGFQVGDRISDPALVGQLAASEQTVFLVRVSHDQGGSSADLVTNFDDEANSSLVPALTV